MKTCCRMLALVGLWWIWLAPPLAADAPAAKRTSEPGEIRIGAASKVINNTVGGWVQGAGVTRRAERIRDDMEANALYLGDGSESILIISCDLIALESPVMTSIREAVGKATGLPPRNVLISCTHNHSGPSLMRSNYFMPLDLPYIARLETWLVELGREAVESAQPARIGWARGEAQIGFNRRVCWADGSHSMHGDTTRKDFAGMEGPDDPQHLAIFAQDSSGKMLAVLHHNTTHPTIFYGAGLYSADFPGVARAILRKEYGEIPILYLNGAQGDIGYQNVRQPRSESREQSLERMGRMVADETLRLAKTIELHDRIILRHAYEDLQVAVRLPDARQLEKARKVLERVDAGEKLAGMEMIFAFGTVHLQETFGERPTDTVPVHVVRIGDVALVTEPCELYCQFGLDIKRRSPAKITAVVGLTDAYCGYCPTIYGILGGGYSGQAISWTRLEPFAGYKIVESAGPMLNRLWRDE